MKSEMDYSTLNRWGLSIVGVGLVVLVGMNLLIDPYGVFGRTHLADGPSVNERYKKVERVQNRPNAFEGLILGSSRSGMTNPEWIEDRTGVRFYNLSAFSAKPSDMRLLYEAYTQTSKPPKIVMIGIDAMSFLVEEVGVDLAKRHHPAVEGSGRLSYWLDYLLAPSLMPSLEKLKAQQQKNVVFDFERGTYELSEYERQIQADHASYMSKKFETWGASEYRDTFEVGELEELLALVETMQEDNVDVRAFIQPMHRQWKVRMSSILPRVKRSLASIRRLQDLSDMDSDQDELWYEQRHYRSEIAQKVVAALFPYPKVGSKGQ